MTVLNALDDGGLSDLLGVRVTDDQALGVAAVFAAVRVISEDVAKLPARLKRRTDTGGEIARGEAEHRVLSSVGREADFLNDGCTAMEWIEATTASAALTGYGVVHLNRVGGIVREVMPIPRHRWRSTRNAWSVQFVDGKWESVRREDLMVLRGPQLGMHVTRYAQQTIALAMHVDRLMLSLARKAGRPNGIVGMDSLTPENASTLIERMRRYFGRDGDGGIMPLDAAGLKFHRLSLSPQELQTDETRRAVIEQIASVYRVQPARLMHMIGDQTHASAHQWNIAHVNDTIQPWALRFCQTFDRDVLRRQRTDAGYYCDIEMNGLLRGAPKERADFLLKLRTMGALSPRGVAELEDLNTEGLSSDPAFPLLTNPNPDTGASETDDA